MTLRRIAISLLAAGLSAASIYPAEPEVLTNSSVVRMIEMGFDPEVIITKIASSPSTRFDTSIEALGAMKEAGASSDVMISMINSSMMMQATAASDSTGNGTARYVNARTGIYVMESDSSETRLLPSIFSGSTLNGTGYALTLGMAPITNKAHLTNAHSSVRVSSSMPSFRFYFNPVPGSMEAFINPTNWWFVAGSSPSEFVLVKLKSNERKNRRELTLESASFLTASSGIDERVSIPFDIRQTGEHLFEVIPVRPLDDGEYCFIYSGQIPQDGNISNQSVFDFTVYDLAASPIHRIIPGMKAKHVRSLMTGYVPKRTRRHSEDADGYKKLEDWVYPGLGTVCFENGVVSGIVAE